MSPILKRAVEAAHADEAEVVEKLGAKTLRAQRKARRGDIAQAVGYGGLAGSQFAANPLTTMGGHAMASAMGWPKVFRDVKRENKNDPVLARSMVGRVADGIGNLSGAMVYPGLNAARAIARINRRNAIIRRLKNKA